MNENTNTNEVEETKVDAQEEARANGHFTTGKPLTDAEKQAVEERKDARVAGDVADKVEDTAENQ